MKKCLLLILTALVPLTTGCRSLFASGSNSVQSPWKDFAEAKTAFDQIMPGQTTTNELECQGFDPFSSPNVKILTYRGAEHTVEFLQPSERFLFLLVALQVRFARPEFVNDRAAIEDDQRLEIPRLAKESEYVEKQIPGTFALRDGQIQFIRLALVLGLETTAHRLRQICFLDRVVRKKTAYHVEVPSL